VLQSNYNCHHKFALHDHKGKTLSFLFACPGCRSRRLFVREGDEEEKKGKALGVANDGLIHVYSKRHLALRRHKSTRAVIRASKRGMAKR
jgi:hypothetical protein